MLKLKTKLKNDNWRLKTWNCKMKLKTKNRNQTSKEGFFLSNLAATNRVPFLSNTLIFSLTPANYRTINRAEVTCETKTSKLQQHEKKSVETQYTIPSFQNPHCTASSQQNPGRNGTDRHATRQKKSMKPKTKDITTNHTPAPAHTHTFMWREKPLRRINQVFGAYTGRHPWDHFPAKSVCSWVGGQRGWGSDPF